MDIFSPMGFISLGVIASNQRKYFQPTTNTDKIFKTVLIRYYLLFESLIL